MLLVIALAPSILLPLHHDNEQRISLYRSLHQVSFWRNRRRLAIHRFLQTVLQTRPTVCTYQILTCFRVFTQLGVFQHDKSGVYIYLLCGTGWTNEKSSKSLKRNFLETLKSDFTISI